MATVAPSADRINHTETTDMMKKLSLEAPPKALEIPDDTKKASVDSSNGMNAQTPSYERSMTPLLQDFMDPAAGYIHNYHSGFYYGSYDGAAKEWDDYARYTNTEGADLSQGVLGENGGLMYPHWYAPYAPYSPAGSPVPTVGQDGPLYGSQHYQYPFYQPLNATSPPFNPTSATKCGNSAPKTNDKTAPLTMQTSTGNTKTIANGGSVKGHNNSAPKNNQIYQNSTFNGSSYGFSDPWLSPMPWFDTSLYPNGQQRPVTSGSMNSSVSNGKNGSSKNQNFRPQAPFMGFQPRPMSGLNSNGYMNSMYPNKYNNYGNAFRSSFPFGSNCYDSRNSRGWSIVDNKYKPKGRNLYGGYGNENVDGLNELNRGPRARNNKNQKGFTPVALSVKGQTIPLSVAADDADNKTSGIPDREQYNNADFPETYADAKFYIIKSYSEDDIHKSIKYNVWASTPNGNKKLDAAYQEAQQKSGGCPVFLFFSVNTSGQFVGVAEMVGPVDFHKNFEYWQQDKWNGFFPVKWHLVKDVSNSLLKHITLEYNENKPVTNSRDTQEVKLEQGLEMLKIFKNHSSKTNILEDFPFYEVRQKTIQEKKSKQQQLPKQTWEGKPATDEKNKDENVNEEIKSQNPLEPASNLVKENDNVAKSSENGSVSKLDVEMGGSESASLSEAKIVTNGDANGI